MLPVHSDQPSWYALYPLIPISPCSMPPTDSYQPLWYARQSTDSDQPLLDFSLFISISPYDMLPTDSDQLSWYAPTGSDQPLCYASFPMRSAPMLCPLPTPISPSDISPTDADQPLWYASRPIRSASMICPYWCRSDLASLIFPPGRGYQPLWYAPIHSDQPVHMLTSWI